MFKIVNLIADPFVVNQEGSHKLQVIVLFPNGFSDAVKDINFVCICKYVTEIQLP